MAQDDPRIPRKTKPTVIPSLPDIMTIGGGFGHKVPAWRRPDLVITAPGGVAMTTPGHAVVSAGATMSLVASHDLNLSSGRNTVVTVSYGLGIFTVGKANDPRKPDQETGLRLHAASGSVSVQARQSNVELVADKAVNVASTADAVTIGAPQHVLFAAGGGSLAICSAGITITTPGPAVFKAAMKELASGANASIAGFEFAGAAARMPKGGLEVVLTDADDRMPSDEPITVVDADGVEHRLSIVAAAATLSNFKPGLARLVQTRRRD